MFVKYNTSWFKRAVAVTLAVTVAFVGLPYLGVDIGIKASAGTKDDGIIRPIEDNSKFVGPGTSNTTDGDYKYTGKIKPVAINLYDYMTNQEINGTWNNIDDNAYTYYDRYNPYDKFNKAMSEKMGTLRDSTISHENNVTLKYVSDYPISGDVYAYIFGRENNTDTPYKAWPGEKMTPTDSTNKEFTYTVVYDSLPSGTRGIVFNGGDGKWQTEDIIPSSFSKDHTYTYGNYSVNTDPNKISVTLTGFTEKHVTPTNVYLWKDTSNGTPWPGLSMNVSGDTATATFSYGTNSGEYSFVPNKFIFNGSNWQTKDCSRTMVLGHNYYFRLGSKDTDNKYLLYGNDSNYVNYKAVAVSSTNKAEDLSVPTSKLYLGYFLASYNNNGKNNDKPESYDNDAKKDISLSCGNSGSYNAFYWQANIAQRPVKLGDTDDTIQKQRPYAAIQGLVDSKLNSNGQITQSGKELPYFNDDLATGSDAVMKAWESTAAEPIAFPFYEVLRKADNNVVGYESGSNTEVEHNAKFYEFNSLSTNLTFNDTTKQFTESTTQIQAAPGTVGFFPFNETNSYAADNGASGKNNNYGFGAKFEMSFKLTEDGKTETVDENGEKITTGAGKVDTRFDFSGDDDIWIFIDGNLVLDLGGDHARTEGFIDFAEKTAVAQKAVTYGTGGVDNLNVDGDSKSVSLYNLITGLDNSTGKYKTDTIHTMTIFYMERGMAESNLLIRFNFTPESIYSKMKVKEQTDFSGVNSGLQNLTQKAAETDVFQYKIENSGTTSDDVLKKNTVYPADDTDTYIREVQGIKTKLTPPGTYNGTTYYVPTTNGANFETIKNVSYNWVDEYAKNSSGKTMSSDKKISGITDSNGYMYLLHGTPSSSNGSEEVKSSGEFEGQFKRYSLMKVTQSNELFTPSTPGTSGSTATLTSTYSPARTVSSYYNIKQNYIFSTVDNSATYNISNGAEFNFRNNINKNDIKAGGTSTDVDANETTPVAMTVQYVNAPKVGSITIKKNVQAPHGDNTYDEEYAEDYKGEFTFKITLSDIFGITGIAPDATYNKYSDIAVIRLDANGAKSYPLYKLTDSGTGDDYHGEFKLKANESLSIANVPIGTKYKIEEVTTNTPNYNPTYTNTEKTIVEGVLDSSIPVAYVDTNNSESYNEGEETENNSLVVNTHIVTDLVLKKEVTPSDETLPEQDFTFRVNLTIPSEINIDHYSLTSSKADQTITVEGDSSKYFDVTIAGNETITISGLPKGVGYTVSEINIPQYWTQTSSSGLTGIITDKSANEATITNNYIKPPDPKITLTKVDATNDDETITSGTAKFKLLKLKKTNASGTINWKDSDTLNAFNEIITANEYSPTTDDYVEAVYESNDYKTTNGVLVLDKVNNITPFQEGDIYFFYEIEAPSGYEVDNTVTSGKIITLASGDNLVTFPNSPSPLSVTVKKVDKDTEEGLSGAEFELWIHEVKKTYDIDAYEAAEPVSVPEATANVPDPLPVLYETKENKSVSYEWSEETDDPNYYYIAFKKPAGWSTVQMVAGTNSIAADKTEGGYCYFKNDNNAENVYFTDETKRTIDIDISSLCANQTLYPNARYGYGYKFELASFTDPGKNSQNTDATGNYMVQVDSSLLTNSNKVSVTEWNSTTTGGYSDYIWFYYGSSNSNMNVRALYYNTNGSSYSYESGILSAKTIGGITHYFYRFEYKSGYQKIMFFNENNNNLFAIQPQDFTENMKGKVYQKGGYSGSNINNHPPGNSNINIGSGFTNNSVGIFNCDNVTGLYANAQYFTMGTTTYSVKTITYPQTPVTPSYTKNDYSAQYQPEDRYAFIDDIVEDNTDVNNFITIDTSMDDAYIMFYDSSGNSVLAAKDVNKPVAAAGMKLSVADKDGSDGSPYRIRLPKNAASFVVSSGAKQTPNTDDDHKISLYDGTYHHAGSTFYIKAELDTESKPTNNGVLDTSKGTGGIVKRVGYTESPNITQPTTKTDAEYIFFTDTSGNDFVDSSHNNVVYAYYYGDVDGEYAAWPGVPSLRRYQNAAGKYVYVFRPPTVGSTAGKYNKVIFNDGTAENSRKITQAQDITLGTIYTTDSTPSSTAYGEKTKTPYGVTTSTKSTTSTISYTSSDYIYFNDNGNPALDDIHFEFFADANGTVKIGNTTPGYIPDKLSIEDKNIYKILIPKGAAYFRVNNGDGSTRTSDKIKITPNGLFKFDGSTNKLKDDFTPKGEDVLLATVVTDSNGTQKYIKENSLKRNGSAVDTEYLDHTTADEGETAGIKVVKVKKRATTKETGEEYDKEKDTYYFWEEIKAPDGYNIDEKTQNIDMTVSPVDGVYTNIFRDTQDEVGGKVTLTKTSKERVGITPIGAPLEGAQFKLIKLTEDNKDSTDVIKFEKTSDGVYKYSSAGEYNYDNSTPSDTSDDKWLTTNSDGKLELNNVPPGSYCFEEQVAPNGYSAIDSLTGKKRRVSKFTVEGSTTDLSLSCTDEMEPAYIQLYEHINEMLEDNWGNPTFIFKITQTQYYNSENELEDVPSGYDRSYTVALTFDDDGKSTSGLRLKIVSADETYNYESWYQESTTEEMENGKLKYGGMFNIINEGSNKGSIRLEPGTYQITRVPVQRYKFVENTYRFSNESNNVYKDEDRRKDTEPMTLTIQAGKTAIVHYYDKVDYYDKFTHVDTKVNQFYQLDETTKANKTIKGIRVEYKTKIPTSSSTAAIETTSDDFNAWFIYADGTEGVMSPTEKANIKFITSDADAAIKGKLSPSDNKLTITDPNTYASKGYTLKASYTYIDTNTTPNKTTTFTTNFDIAFAAKTE